MADDDALLAHVLRRCSFGPFPGQVELAREAGAEATIERLIETDDHAEIPQLTEDDDGDELTRWWLDHLHDPTNGLHEKMTWFWHGHFTSSVDKAPAHLLARQHALLRRDALGNFRTLVRSIVDDPAMLLYLDASGSSADAPNENLGRELLELFTLGRGNYTQADVIAAATGLSGRWVDSDTGTVEWDADIGHFGDLTFLGRTQRFEPEQIADAVCDHEACAPFIAAKLHELLVGTTPTDGRRGELADVFRGADLELRPLVREILHGPDFGPARLSRPKWPIEWVVGAGGAIGQAFDDPWELDGLGQVPFRPPNVAGWPLSERWFSPGQQLARTAIVHGANPGWMAPVTDRSDVVDASLAHVGLFEVSAQTRRVLDEAARAPAHDGRDALLLSLALLSPEFALA